MGSRLGMTSPEYIVLDGQQRLTALYYALIRTTKGFSSSREPRCLLR